TPPSGRAAARKHPGGRFRVAAPPGCMSPARQAGAAYPERGDVAEGEGMDEQQWGAWTDPRHGLGLLWGKVGSRRKRLCSAACCRRLDFLIHQDRYLRMIDVVERYADRRATGAELAAAHAEAGKARGRDRVGSTCGKEAARTANLAAYWATAPLEP